jgi:hypothetical protein
MKKAFIGEATVEQVAEWKAKYKKVHEIEVDGHVGYLKSPGRRELSHATTVGGSDPIRFNEILLGDCWLGGSDAIKSEDELFLGASAVLGSIVTVATATIKNL